MNYFSKCCVNSVYLYWRLYQQDGTKFWRLDYYTGKPLVKQIIAASVLHFCTAMWVLKVKAFQHKGEKTVFIESTINLASVSFDKFKPMRFTLDQQLPVLDEMQAADISSLTSLSSESQHFSYNKHTDRSIYCISWPIFNCTLKHQINVRMPIIRY